jgi:hypothetical protein
MVLKLAIHEEEWMKTEIEDNNAKIEEYIK